MDEKINNAAEDVVRSALAQSARARRASERAESAKRRARMLTSLEHSLFGYRMPPAAAVIAAAGWLRDALDRYCSRCGTTRVPFEDLTNGCAECRARRLPFAATVRLGRYAPPLSQWVPAIKSRAWRDMAVTLGRELALGVREAIEADRIAQPDIVTAVPVHWLRRVLRGIDHTEAIATEIASVLRVPYQRTLRGILAHRQAGATQSERARQSRYRLRDTRNSLRGLHVLLVDDVRTTGATIYDAAKALQSQHVRSLSIAVCAAADPPSRNALC